MQLIMFFITFSLFIKDHKPLSSWHIHLTLKNKMLIFILMIFKRSLCMFIVCFSHINLYI